MLNIKTKIIVMAAGLLFGACNNSKTSDMNTHENHKSPATYACPMHPEATGKQGDKCPQCGMELVSTANQSDHSTVQLTTIPEVIEAGSRAELILVFKKSGRPINLQVAHEKKIHLMVISEDLSWFRHIHPEEQKDGSYKVSETFPHGGRYLLFADYTPAGGSQTISKQEIDVKGASNTKDVFSSLKTVSEVDGYKVTLENGSDLRTNRTQELKVLVEKDGKKLSENDIEQYLGATAHIVMVGQADKEYLHIHPVTNARYPIYAQTIIKKPGAYRIWVEFKAAGKVHTADFTVNVATGAEEAEKQPHEHSGHNH